MDLETVLSELHFEPVIGKAVAEKIKKNERLIGEIAETAYGGNDFDFPLCKRMPLTRLAVVTYILKLKYSQYKAIGASDAVIWDTFGDVALRANYYWKRNGKIGISKEDVIWFRHIMHVSIFKIGVLQFQNFEMLYLDEETIGEAYMKFAEEQKKELPNGAPVINCHIQRDADISLDLVKESLEQAKLLFAKCFPNIQYKAFLCYSWLLYPPMLKSLANESNIKRFAGLFSIIGACNDSKQAMENLFDHGKPNASDNLTSLQRMAMEHPDILGFGCGVIRT